MEKSEISSESIARLATVCEKCGGILPKKDYRGGSYYYCENCRGASRGVLVAMSKSGEASKVSAEAIISFLSKKAARAAEVA
ncbi:MAG TPA: hypothetical protein PLF30_04575 [Candidatus Moranbacteria bacterium]|jgi:hypothetical protein|nr:hypothetical protein [Candidatus Moranbacteria bacterium]HQB60018.1 hypothetical protein [Candidatus Moranbacteria bacterium]